ncbi:hypothetical protein ACVITL_005750 [Rhizobium pisi]
MRLKVRSFVLLVSLQLAASVGDGLAQQLDIYKDGSSLGPGLENMGSAWKQPQIIFQPSVASQPQPHPDYGEIAAKVLEGNATPTKEQLKERLEEYMKPAYSPGTIVFMAPASVPTYSSVEYGPGLLQGASRQTAETASISDDVVAFVNRASGPFEFQLTIGATGRKATLVSNGFRTYECLTDCVLGALVRFDTSISTVPGELRVKGGEVYTVNYTDTVGWTVTKVNKISYLLPQ